MLKLTNNARNIVSQNQPPSGGCVLKPSLCVVPLLLIPPAAFRRLCVETFDFLGGHACLLAPAAFRRLCVETRPN
ncbi:hypothetical protein HMPREF1051_1267 [Neisseria sicca VK64]|uniref:Uncharacterized protein n=1 Tax=Neisseria sicca VK64 TaxID=1095748 RepID=I2NX75_NEISI|nr:hypothetical protein HMPREF1051_1267 [Neisseria sicca VK64]